MGVVGYAWTLASLLYQDGERRVFTNSADIACIEREAP